MTDVSGKFFSAKKVRTGVSPSSPGVEVGETLPPVNPPGGGLNSVGLTMPSAFAVANSPLTSNGTLAVTGAGTVAQYVRGDGSLADFPESSGGGSSVSYYLNGSVSQGTIGGVAYLEMNKVPILGAGTDFTRNSNGYIASFITDAGDPNLLEIPGGNWNFESFFSASSGGGSPTFYVELYKVNAGGTATLIASNSANPELISFGTTISPYFSSLAVPTTTLALTDRLAVRYYVTPAGRTLTLHTEGPHLCQIITTFTTGLTALNGLTTQVQFFAVGTSGTDFNIASATATHTFNLPTASATNRGALSSADWALFTQAYNDKINSASVTGTTTKTLTLTQQDGGTITASWSDLNTDAVISVFGRTGAVVAANGDYTTAQVTESGNLYFTQSRVSANTDVAANTAARHNAVTLGTANGLSLSTQVLSLGLASAGVTGALSGTDWSTFNSKQNALTLTTTGTSGVATLVGSTLNIPNYGSALSGYLPLTGGTLTGPLNGTIASFTANVGINSSTVNERLVVTQTTNNTSSVGFYTNASTGTSFGPIIQAGTNSSDASLRVFNQGGTSPYLFVRGNGNVGIATDTPATTLEINGVGLFSGGSLVGNTKNGVYILDSRIISLAGSGARNLTISAQTLSIETGISYSEKFKIFENGNVVISTSPSDAGFKLDVNGTGRFSGASGAFIGLTINNTDSTGSARLRVTSTGGNINDFSSFSASHPSRANQAWLGGDGSSTVTVLQAGGNEFLRGSSTGAATFSSSVTIGSTFNINSSSWLQFSGNNVLLGDDGNTFLQASGGGSIIFRNNAATRIMTMTTGGNVGIGTPTPGNPLVVQGSNTIPQFRIIRQENTNQGFTIRVTGGETYFNSYDGSNIVYGNYLFQATKGSDTQTRMEIANSGNVLIGTTTDAGAVFRLQVARTGGSNYLNVITDNNAGYDCAMLFSDGTNQVYAGMMRGSTGLTGAYTIWTGGSARLNVTSGGSVSINNLSGSGNRIVVANSSGTLISAVIGSGLAFDGTTLTATGGSSGSISGSGTSGTIALFTGATSIGNSAISQSGSNITVTGDIRSNAIYRDYQGEALIHTSGSDTQIGSFGAGTPRTISLLAGNDRRLFITTGGRVLIGTTSDNGNLLRVNGTIFSDSSVTATSFFESSDATLKTLIQDDYQAKGIDNVVAKLYIKNGKQELGYFAQDLESILPSAVNKGSDGLLNLSYREVHTAKIASLENRIKELELQLKNN
jgi:hypothetical protein